MITTNLRNVQNHKIPLFYQDIVNTWQALKFDKRISNPNDSLHKFTFTNPIIMNNGKTLYYPNWMDFGITKIKDIWHTDRYATIEEIMRNHNIPNRNRDRMIKEYNNIKQAIPNHIVEGIQGVDGKDLPEIQFLNVEEMYHVNKEALKSKHIYYRLIYMKLRGFQQGLRVLENAGLTQNNIKLDKLQSWWSVLYKSNIDNKIRELQWQISHKALYTFRHLNEIDPEISKRCIFCKEVDESLDHVFCQCTPVLTFWEWIFREFNFTTTLEEKFLYLNSFESVTDFQFLVLLLGKSTIWDTRRILRNSPLINLLKSLKVNVKSKLQSHLSTLYLCFKDKGKADAFRQSFMPLGKVETTVNSVVVNLNMH